MFCIQFLWDGLDHTLSSLASLRPTSRKSKTHSVTSSATDLNLCHRVQLLSSSVSHRLAPFIRKKPSPVCASVERLVGDDIGAKGRFAYHIADRLTLSILNVWIFSFVAQMVFYPSPFIWFLCLWPGTIFIRPWFLPHGFLQTLFVMLASLSSFFVLTHAFLPDVTTRRVR